jgi:superfamily II DNA/RNA helicase
MDFPLVTNVFQVGIPLEKEAYIHRLGRTARAGAEGRGTFIITGDETFFSKWTLKEITFEPTAADLSAKKEILSIAEKMEPEMQAKVYQAWVRISFPFFSRFSLRKWEPRTESCRACLKRHRLSRHVSGREAHGSQNSC